MPKAAANQLPSFATLLGSRASKRPLPGRLLALDPGFTTGWALFINGKLAHAGQIDTGDLSEWRNVEALIDKWRPTEVVFEEYVLYSWKASTQKWSDMPICQLIGAIRYICLQRGIPGYAQGANDAKGFCTDQKLRSWSYWSVGKRHANDAVRHGCYWILWGREGSRANQSQGYRAPGRVVPSGR